MGGFLISGALLYDGTLRAPDPADVVVEGAEIKAVAPAGTLEENGRHSIRAEGLSLAPGFIDAHSHSDAIIDAHSHSDATVLAAPEACGKISQGVTTEITGNCGLSAFPVLTDTVREHLNSLYAACGVRVSWNDLNGYAAELERRGPAVNIASLCGHNTLRANIAGYEAKALSEAERGRMAELLEETLRQGAAGFSTGLLYTPGRFADTEEMRYTVSGETVDVLESALLSNEESAEAITGSFTMTDRELAADDVVCIYESADPRERDYTQDNYENDAVAYIRITGVDGDTYQFESLNEEDTDEVLAMPDTVPYQVASLPDQDGTVNKNDYDAYARSMLGMEKAPVFEINDFLVFYTEDFASLSEESAAVYGQVTDVSGDTVSYRIVERQEIEEFMGMFVTQ